MDKPRIVLKKSGKSSTFRAKPKVSKIKGSKLKKLKLALPNKNDGKNKDMTDSQSTPKVLSYDNKDAVLKKPLSLGRSRGAWSRSRRSLDPMARLTAKIRIRLNKITLDNFSSLSDQLITIFQDEITNTQQLTKFVTLIFEKTVLEHIYGPLYAKLCAVLAQKNKSFDDFKNVLVKVCQTEFERGKRELIITDDMDEIDKENQVIKQKIILLGTMKFIGHLYLNQLMASKVITVCLNHLIGEIDSKASEDDVERACTLLQIVGQTLDKDESVNKSQLTEYYSKLRNIEKNSNEYSVRIKVITQNLIDLKKNNWKPPNIDVTLDENIDSIQDDFDDNHNDDATEVMQECMVECIVAMTRIEYDETINDKPRFKAPKRGE